ncbi:MAG: hypothetical protein Kow0099_11520 [Candidatus Abyssubacteria bacterium]
MDTISTQIHSRKHVLIIDSNVGHQINVKKVLFDKRIICHEALSFKAALRMLSKRTYDAVLLELNLPDRDGYELVKMISEKSPSTQVVVLTSSADFRRVSRCITAGAFNYLRKPFHPEQLEFMIETAFEAQPSPSENLFLVEQAPQLVITTRLVGKSRAMQKIHKQIRLSSAADIHVLLMGESGTGKELIARAIHEQSERSQERFIAVNTGAIDPRVQKRADSCRPPLYPLMICGAFLLLGVKEYAGVMVSGLFFILLGPLTYLFGKRLSSRSLGLSAAVVVMFLPQMWDYSMHALTEMSFAFLLTLLLYLVYINANPLLTGAVFGLCYLERYNALV